MVMKKKEQILEEIFNNCDKRKVSVSKIFSTPNNLSTQKDDEENINIYYQLRSASAIHIDGNEKQKLFQVKRSSVKRKNHISLNLHNNFVDRKIVCLRVASM